MKKIIFVIIFFLLSIQCLASPVTVSLKLSPDKSAYEDNESLNLLFSCSTSEKNIKGDIYVVLLTPAKIFYSFTPNGILSGIKPFVKNYNITNINQLSIFKFKYYPVFKQGNFQIVAVILNSETDDVISNVFKLDIPYFKNDSSSNTSEDNSSNTSENNNSHTSEDNGTFTWNTFKKIYQNYYKPFAFKSGNNYIHLLTYKGEHELYYFKFDNSGHVITPAYKLPFKLYGTTYLPAFTVDKNDNLYFLYLKKTDEKGLYVCKISSNGEIVYNKILIDRHKFYNYNYPYKLKISVYNDKVYFIAYTANFYVRDKIDYNKKTKYERTILFGSFSTDGELIFGPSPICGKVIEYYKNKRVEETDSVYVKYPEMIADNNGVVHIFWNEKDSDLKTDYYLKYLRFDPNGNSNSYIVPLAKIGNYESRISVCLDNNTIFVGYRDKTNNPYSMSILKLSTDGKLLQGPTDTHITDLSSGVPSFINKINNQIVIDYSNSYYMNEKIFDDSFTNVIKDSEKIFRIYAVFYYFVTKDISNNMHIISLGIYKNYGGLYYSNNIKDSDIFENSVDIVVSPNSFSCSPSNNVDVGKSITCSFDVFNISDNDSNGGYIEVKVNRETLLSQSLGTIESFSSKQFTFTYSPTSANTPEYPEVSIKVYGIDNELTEVNNKINPSIRVRPVPTVATFSYKVYDESLDPNHEFTMPTVSNADCKLYDANDNLIATPESNKFTDIPIGSSESDKKVYTIKCSAENYNEVEQDVEIWRDDSDPYKIDFSPFNFVKLYMNNWGSLALELTYLDDNGEEKSLSGADVYLSGGGVTRHVEMDDSSGTINNLPAGDYSIKIEKENYKRITGSLTISVGGVTGETYTTEKTDTGDIKIKITSDAGYIPTTATVKFSSSSNNKTITVENGYYSGSIKKGYYEVTVTASDFNTYTENFTVKAGLSNELDINLEASTPSSLKSYTREKEVALVPYTVIAEWPSTFYSSGYKVQTIYGAFTIDVGFLGEENNNEIYSLKQLKVAITGLNANYYNVSTTWDPLDIIDLPSVAEAIYNVYGALPMAVTPEIPISMGGGSGKTKVRVDAIVIKDDLGNILLSDNNTFYSDVNYLFNVDKILDNDATEIITEIYMKIGQEDGFMGEFKDIDNLDSADAQYLKLTYHVPKEKPEYGWYLYEPVTGQEVQVTTHFQQSVAVSFWFDTVQVKYKPFIPYTIDMEYVLPNDYKKNILGFPTN